jgi:DNA repair exonuclease SbcCD ATPase subunit
MNRKRKDALADELVDDLLELEDESSTSMASHAPTESPMPEAKPSSGIKESLKKMIQMKKSVSEPNVQDVGAVALKSQVGQPADRIETTPNSKSDDPIIKNNLTQSVEAVLRNSDNLQIAQDKITSLEQELEDSRRENEKILVAGEIVNQRNQELISKNSKLEKKLDESAKDFLRESDLLKESGELKTKQIKDLKLKNDEYDSHLNAKIKQISRRERDLENRLELMKKESSVLMKSKNDDLINLHRQIDQLKMEIENFRKKGLYLNQEIQQKDEMMSKTIRALKMALNVLDQKIDLDIKLKKVE